VQRMLDEHPGSEARFLQDMPIQRFGQPEEIAEAVVWLCSDAASLVTGISLPVDGAYTAH